jgi:hypothetical protein
VNNKMPYIFLGQMGQPNRFPLKKQTGASKYGGRGLFTNITFEGRNIPSSLKPTLVKAANFSIANKTWSTYNSAHNMLLQCSSDTNSDLSLPLSEDKTLIFIAWCIEKGNAVSTVRSYLSGLKTFQVANKFGEQELLTPLVNKVLQGHEHMPKAKAGSSKRLPCTISILKLLKTKLRIAKLDKQIKLLIWSACTIAFYGAFRMGELLCKSVSTYDPRYSLLRKDVTIIKCKVRAA